MSVKNVLIESNKSHRSNINDENDEEQLLNFPKFDYLKVKLINKENFNYYKNADKYFRQPIVIKFWIFKKYDW